MFKSTIDWRLIIVNQYYNFPAEFLGEKVGRFGQAARQLRHCSYLETNRLKICPVARLKGLHETLFPLVVEESNRVLESPKHFLPRPAGEILLCVNELSEQFGGKINEP